VAKINAEKLEIHFVPGNFYRLVEKVWKISAMTLKQKNLKGEVRIAHKFPKFIEMDSHRLTQILLNLIGNASKFALEGFVHVIITWHEEKSSMSELIEPSQDFKLLTSKRKRTLINKSATTVDSISQPKLTDAPSIEFANENEKSQAIDEFLHREFCPKFFDQVVSSSFIQSSVEDTALESKTDVRFQSSRGKEKGIIKIEVVDSGCGMSPESIKDLFQPFKQADASITRQFGGTGLGLFITKQIIQKMGGEIYVQSKEGVGSSFTVLLPATTASQEDVDQENVNDAQDEAEMNIENPVKALVVDDIQVNQLILSSYLKKMNIESDVANNGLDAVNIFKAKGPNHYSFITMDLQMPVMDGLTASAEIRKYEKILGVKEIIPIIVVTGNCTDTEKTMCLDPQGNIRASNFFRKPFTFAECKSTIQTLLAEAQSATIKKPLRMLIVDDDALSGQVSEAHFAKSGFVCTNCKSGKEALNVIHKESFELILINCDMLEIDGYVTAKHIRSLNPNVFIVGMTGHRREECLKKSQENGISEIQTKPVDYRKLSMLMRKKLSESN
jgi:CheY-like chemotaxis protein/signal transduction histidine kinase